MRTTVDIPDELFRRAKVEAASRGRKLKDLVADGLRLLLAAPAGSDSPAAAPPRRVTAHDLAKHLILDVDSPADLSTNKNYFDDFGR